jgi:hypothetical protein
MGVLELEPVAVRGAHGEDGRVVVLLVDVERAVVVADRRPIAVVLAAVAEHDDEIADERGVDLRVAAVPADHDVLRRVTHDVPPGRGW